MRIGFDGKRAVCNNTGLGNYSRLVVDLLSEYYPHNEYYIYSPKIRENVRLSPILQKTNAFLLGPEGLWSNKFSSIWRIAGMNYTLVRDKIDIYHGLSNELPLNIMKSGIPSVVTIHDLIFLRYPEYYNAIDVKIYDYKFRKACENSDRVIAISECTKRDIVDYYKIDPEKIDVIYQGCDESFRKQLSEDELSDIEDRYNLPKKFILYVGTIEKRKNLLLILKSLVNLPQELDLVVIGGQTEYFKEVTDFIEEHGLKDRVHFHHGLPFSDLPGFYQLAQVFVYPSRFEGFGIPMLEALASGTPAIGATGSCLEEAGGPESLYVNPDNDAQLTEAILKVLNDDSLREKMIEAGLKYSQKFTRKEVARNIMNVYEKISNLRH